MAFTTPRDWTDEELLDATIMNAHIRDNLRYLKGLDGTITLEDALTIGANGAGHTVTLYGDTSGSRLVWYDPGNQLYFIGASSIMGIGTGALNWAGAASLGSLNVIGNSSVQGNLSAGSLTIAGTGTFQGGLSTASSLTVIGEGSFQSGVGIDGSLTVQGAGSFQSSIGVVTSATIGGDAIIGGNIELTGNLRVVGTSQFDSAVTGISLDEIENLSTDKTFTMATNNLTFDFTTPSTGLVLNVIGAFSTQLLHLHQSIGNPGADTEMLHIDSTDPDVKHLHSVHYGDNASYEAFEYQLDRATPTDGDNITSCYHFDNYVNAEKEFILITATATDVTEDTEDAEYKISLIKAGTMTDVLTIAGTVITLGAPLTLGGDVTGGNYDLDNIGHIGLGNRAADADFGIYYAESYLITDNAGKVGIELYIDGAKTSAVYIGEVYGAYIQAWVANTNTQNWTDAVGLYGIYSQVGIVHGAASESIITGAASFYADLNFSTGAGANETKFINYYGLYVEATALVGSSKLTNDYGIWIGDQAGGATLNYAIYTNDGLVRFGDTTDLCAGVAVFYSWGAVFADDYYLFMQSDYSSYVAGLDSGYLDLGANTGIRMRVGASGVVFTMTAQSLVIGYATTFNGRIIMGGAGSYLNLLQTDVNSNDEGDVWYDASENTVKVCLGGASVDTLATTANIATHAALTATHGVAGAIVGTTDSQALTNKSYNGLTLTSTTGTFTLASGKTFTVSNTLTLTATDTATLAIGGGGTLGSAAYTASTDYVAKATYDAHSILIAINDNSPVKLDVAASRMIGRASSGNIVALAKADILTLINVTEAADVTGSNTCDTPGGADTDTTAIHDNTANEITAITLKGTPVAADEVVLEDSAASYVKKSATVGTLGSGIKLDDLATPDDVVDLNSSTTAHGLLKKLDNVATNFMDGQGNWSVPAGGNGATMEFFTPVTYSSGTFPHDFFEHPVATLDAVDENAKIEFMVPADYSSITEAEITISSVATQGAADYDISARYGADGESFGIHAESDTASTYSVTASEFFGVDISGILSSLAPGDHVGVSIVKKVATGTESYVKIYGVHFKYS